MLGLTGRRAAKDTWDELRFAICRTNELYEQKWIAKRHATDVRGRCDVGGDAKNKKKRKTKHEEIRSKAGRTELADRAPTGSVRARFRLDVMGLGSVSNEPFTRILSVPERYG